MALIPNWIDPSLVPADAEPIGIEKSGGLLDSAAAAAAAAATATATALATAAATAADATAAPLLPHHSPHAVALQLGELQRRLPSQAVRLVALTRVGTEIGGGSEPKGPERSIRL